MRIPFIARLVMITLLAGCSLESLIEDNKPAAASSSSSCVQILRSRCNATQEQLLDELLKKLGIYGHELTMKKYPNRPEAFQVLPKDEIGLVNWSKAYAEKLITPLGTMDGSEEKHYEGYLENLIFMQAQVVIMADVLFPHGMHSDLMSCNSCHPRPFKKKIGANNIKMKEIFQGKWCGKCHGKVAFPTKPYHTCWRCHLVSKRVQ